jgi:hypothetical protein
LSKQLGTSFGKTPTLNVVVTTTDFKQVDTTIAERNAHRGDYRETLWRSGANSTVSKRD